MAELKGAPLREAAPSDPAPTSNQGIAIDLDQLFASKDESGSRVARTPKRNGAIHVSEEDVLSDLLRKDTPHRTHCSRRGKQWSSKNRKNNH